MQVLAHPAAGRIAEGWLVIHSAIKGGGFDEDEQVAVDSSAGKSILG